MVQDISFEEYLLLSRITFEWADSYDSKDFARLSAILAPTVTLDYSEAFGQKPITMARDDFVTFSGRKEGLGGVVDCIHHIGGSKFERKSEDHIIGYHQIKTEYKRYTDMEKKEIEATGQGLTLMEHWYKKINGEWKLAGTKPCGRMNDFNFEKIFPKRSEKAKI